MPPLPESRFPYDVFLSEEAGWDVRDVRTNRPVQMNQRLMVSLPARAAELIADHLNGRYRDNSLPDDKVH